MYIYIYKIYNYLYIYYFLFLRGWRCPSGGTWYLHVPQGPNPPPPAHVLPVKPVGSPLAHLLAMTREEWTGQFHQMVVNRKLKTFELVDGEYWPVDWLSTQPKHCNFKYQAWKSSEWWPVECFVLCTVDWDSEPQNNKNNINNDENNPNASHDTITQPSAPTRT